MNKDALCILRVMQLFVHVSVYLQMICIFDTGDKEDSVCVYVSSWWPQLAGRGHQRCAAVQVCDSH